MRVYQSSEWTPGGGLKMKQLDIDVSPPASTSIINLN